MTRMERPTATPTWDTNKTAIAGDYGPADQTRGHKVGALGNQCPRCQRLLDVLGDLSGQLVACVQAELQLLPAKVDDAEYENALMTVCVALAGEVLLRAGDRLPHGVRPLAKGVIAAKHP